MRELCGDTAAADPADLTQDLLLIYEGTQNTIALNLDPTPNGRGRRLTEQQRARAL